MRTMSAVTSPEDLQEQPAVRAWLRLHPERAAVSALDLLKGHWPTIGSPTRRMVCRLWMASGQSIIAKLCKHAKARIEHTVYQDVLPHLERFGNRALRYYGTVEEVEGELDWIFVDYADGAPFSLEDEHHRLLVSRWLAAVHAATEGESFIASQLPDAGSGRYLRYLQGTQMRIDEGFDNPALGSAHWGVLGRVRSYCSAIEAEWQGIETFCAGFPQTLVHGDLVAKNMCVGSGLSGNPLLVYDWSTAGWGVPSADLTTVDVPAFLAVADSPWGYQGIAAVEKLATLGLVFRYIAAIHWELVQLEFPWVDKPIANLSSYLAGIQDAMARFKRL